MFFFGGNLSGFEWDKSGEHHKTWMNNWEVGWIVSRKFQWIGLREILQERPRFNGKMDGFPVGFPLNQSIENSKDKFQELMRKNRSKNGTFGVLEIVFSKKTIACEK